MIDCNTSTDILYEKSANQKYSQPTYHNTHRVFVPDPLLSKPRPRFVPDPLLAPPPGIEPGSEDFQSSAMTTFAKAAMVPCDRIELPSLLCKSRALPLDEQGMG